MIGRWQLTVPLPNRIFTTILTLPWPKPAGSLRPWQSY
jgi:hypothetical protein